MMWGKTEIKKTLKEPETEEIVARSREEIKEKLVLAQSNRRRALTSGFPYAATWWDGWVEALRWVLGKGTAKTDYQMGYYEGWLDALMLALRKNHRKQRVRRSG
jgi:hypothetical protein